MKRLVLVGCFMVASSAFAWQLNGGEITEDTYSCEGNTTCTFTEDTGCGVLTQKKNLTRPTKADGNVEVEDITAHPEEDTYLKSEHELYVESITEHRAMPISYKFELQTVNVRSNQGRSCVLPDQNELRVYQKLEVFPQAPRVAEFPIYATTTVQGALFYSMKKTKTFHVVPWETK